MTQQVAIRLEGPPMPWKRTLTGRKGQRITPKEMRVEKRRIAVAGMAAAAEQRFAFARKGTPVGCRMSFCLRRSWVATPDWDNLGKMWSDALNGVLYHDDAQIVDSHVTKHDVRELEGRDAQPYAVCTFWVITKRPPVRVFRPPARQPKPWGCNGAAPGLGSKGEK